MAFTTKHSKQLCVLNGRRVDGSYALGYGFLALIVLDFKFF